MAEIRPYYLYYTAHLRLSIGTPLYASLQLQVDM